MAKLSGGEMIVQALKDEGVDMVFGYPGGAVLHIYDALFQNAVGLTHVLVRHEQAAAHAADGYARATGKPGVVLVTSGPGATNAITGIATAYMDSIPLVVISGQVPREKIGEDAFQETDMVGVSRPIVKHSFMVRHAEQIPEIFRKAFHIAASGRPGPVVIDVPKDVTNPVEKFDYSYPERVRMRSYNPVTKGHSGQIRKAVNLIMGASRPVIYSGGGVVQGNGSQQLRRLARMLDIPVTSTLMGLGAYPASDRQFLGMLGMHGTYEANMAMHYSDLIVAIGARFDDRVTNSPDRFCPDAKIVHIDIDPTSISKTVRADLPITGPVAPVLDEMISQLEDVRRSPEDERNTREELGRWWKQIEQWRQDHGIYVRSRYDCGGELIMPQDVIKTVHELTSGNAFVTSDVGQHQMFAAQYYGFDEPRRWINSGGLGTMGFGLPAAMGVKLAFPESEVVCITGEGSIQMCIQELSTCTQYGLGLKIVNMNNGYLGMVKQWQDMQYAGRHSHSSYSDSLPDFVKLAEAYGHIGIRVENKADMRPAIQRALEQKDRLVFLDIVVDPHEHVYPMHVAPNGSMRDMWLSKTERT